VYFPERLEASLSVDGTAWAPAGAARDRPADGTGSERRAGAMTVRLDAPCTARFVRLALGRRGWAMVHEVEIY